MCKQNEKAREAELLEEDVGKLEQELSDRYYQLGKSMYEIADRRVDDINQLVDRLVQTKVQLTAAREQRTCLHCLALNPKDHVYCGRCGCRLDAIRKDGSL